MSKRASIVVVLLLFAQADVCLLCQPRNAAVADQQNSSRVPSDRSKASENRTAANSQEANNANGDAGCTGPSCEQPLTHIAVTNAPPVRPFWPLQDRIAWAANLVLVLVGYVGVTVAIRTLRRIEIHAKLSEEAVQAALETAHAVLAHSKAMINAERPWLLMTFEPSVDVENSFRIKVTNRGRTPAEIVATTGRIAVVVDERYLPKTPEYATAKPASLGAPIILLAGESTLLQRFGREDVKLVCKTDESFRRIEQRQENIFLYGKILYKSLIAPDEGEPHETSWCCRYVHGGSSSSLVAAGNSEYNKHT